MKKFLFSVIYIIFLVISVSAQENKPAYLNTDLTVRQRVDDLVSRMTLEEKVSQMIDVAKPIQRLGIPEYNWWNEALHGVARAGTATVFPQAIGLAATWNTDLMFRVADVISTEARAKHHEAVKNNDFARNKGLTFWSPNINIFRDPRWGRGQETYGEDPWLTARMGVAFVKGLQGDDPKYLKLVATPKHYAVHSGPEPERHSFNAITDKRDLYQTYLPAFEACIKEAKAYSVMCAYNRYMGQACCGSDTLLTRILRKDWKFDGYIVSDCGAINDIFRTHKVVETPPEAAALAVKSGTDLECGRVYDPALLEAAKKGLIPESEIDISLKRLFTARFKLGMFDPPEMVPYSKIPYTENDTREHRELSSTAAMESIVLLKNEGNILPLRKDLKKIAVIGPTADSYLMLLGNYNGTPSTYTTPLKGIINKVSGNTEVVYEQGCNLADEGPVVFPVTSEMTSFDGNPGLQAEYFDNINLEGKPFYNRIDPMGNLNWLAGARIPGMRMGMKYSARWSGKFISPVNGSISFTVSGAGGYRLIIDGKPLIEDWAEHEATTKSGSVNLEKGKQYDFKAEYFYSTGRPQLNIQWDVLNADHFKNAVTIASSADAVVFVGGITAQLEGEEMRVNYDGFRGGDRTSLDLPRVQEQLLKALYKTGKPVILVLTSGSALSVNWEKENLPGIVQLWYPGEEGGTALADVLFGEYNPAGRLPVTFYKSADQLPPFEDYNMKGRTYRYFEDEPLFPFGYGLSYTTFNYSNLKLPLQVKAGEPLPVSVTVKNTGQSEGDEVVQLYVNHPEATVPTPIRALQGFKRIHLKPGEAKKVSFTLNPKQLSVFNNDGKFMVEPSIIRITVGGGIEGQCPFTSGTLTGAVKISGEPVEITEK
jgi:beta-glucosidase